MICVFSKWCMFFQNLHLKNEKKKNEKKNLHIKNEKKKNEKKNLHLKNEKKNLHLKKSIIKK
ncbi:hypothetical protein M153_6121000671 [Pseudoloma neurophilia]|uniref:Uncharacterized protein n=1 Tax=Pseudoloma neurophilia TaxID=146866 RepID=A0A0R0LSF4_9MICR|nr:hypothetical protein M153_6121000671 [Pseudoloma neurophilia]